LTFWIGMTSTSEAIRCFAQKSSYRVGYESPSQFSREYRRLFGAPPRRDVTFLQTAPPLMTG